VFEFVVVVVVVATVCCFCQKLFWRMFACVQLQDSPPIERIVSIRDKEAVINPLASRDTSSPITVAASSPSSAHQTNNEATPATEEIIPTTPTTTTAASPPDGTKKMTLNPAVFLPSLSEKLAGLSDDEKNQIHFPVIIATKEQDTMFKYTVPYRLRLTRRQSL